MNNRFQPTEALECETIDAALFSLVTLAEMAAATCSQFENTLPVEADMDGRSVISMHSNFVTVTHGIASQTVGRGLQEF